MAQQNQGCLAALFRSLGSSDTKPGSVAVTFPYRVRQRFLSPAEAALYAILRTDPRYAVFANVRFLDLIDVSERRTNQAAFNRIDRKQMDFILCEPGTFRPLLAIELDDSTHAQQRRVDRDQFVEQALRTAGLPLLRLRVQAQYDAPQVWRQIAAILTPNAPPRSAG